MQQRQILPLFQEPITNIPGNTTVKWIIAVPKFTIPNQKKFECEIFEKDGGRNLVLSVKNGTIFQARSID
jgi:hypothetical protein